MSKKYRSDAMAAVHETMAALYEVGVIDKQTMRRFGDACLTPSPEVCSLGEHRRTQRPMIRTERCCRRIGLVAGVY